jgi:hypothetical protein
MKKTEETMEKAGFGADELEGGRTVWAGGV